jgi:hydrogenase/urease accessory protein HupE
VPIELPRISAPVSRVARPAWWAGLCLLVLARPAAAHPLLQDPLWVVVAPTAVHVRVGASLREIATAAAGPVGAAGALDDEALQAAIDKYPDYLLRHLRVTVRGEPLEGRLVRTIPPAGPERGSAPDQVFVQYEIDYPIDARTPPPSIALDQDVLRDVLYAPGQRWDVTYAVRIKRSDAHDIATALLRAGSPFVYDVGGFAPAPPPSLLPTLAAYLRHGVHHILTGFDHLLFICALVLAAASLWDLVKVVAAFTLAHSITLALAVLGVVRLPAAVVEPVIAASIVFVAIENVAWPARSRGLGRLLVAFGFGLVHGLGFAGGLLDAMRELPGAQIATAIVSFSAGVELGHMMVVVPLFAALSLLRRRAPHLAAANLRYASMLISACGAYYLWIAVPVQSLMGSVHAR